MENITQWALSEDKDKNEHVDEPNVEEALNWLIIDVIEITMSLFIPTTKNNCLKFQAIKQINLQCLLFWFSYSLCSYLLVWGIILKH